MNLYALICGEPSLLRNCLRYNNSFCNHRENVAEHMFYTAFYTMMIGQWLLEKGKKLELETAITGALVHDVDEYFSGDIIRPFKHSSVSLSKEIDKVNDVKVSDFFTGIFGETAQ